MHLLVAQLLRLNLIHQLLEGALTGAIKLVDYDGLPFRNILLLDGFTLHGCDACSLLFKLFFVHCFATHG